MLGKIDERREAQDSLRSQVYSREWNMCESNTS